MTILMAVAVGVFSTAEVLADDTVTAEIRGSLGDAHQIAIPDATSDAPFSFDIFLTTSFDTGNVDSENPAFKVSLWFTFFFTTKKSAQEFLAGPPF